MKSVKANGNQSSLHVEENNVEDIDQNCCDNNIQNKNDKVNDKNIPQLKGFRIGHLNTNSLKKHIDEMRVYLRDIPFDTSIIMNLN